MWTNEAWMLAATGAAVGLACGGLGAWAWTRARFLSRLDDARAEQQRLALQAEKSKASQVRLRAELEEARGATRRQLAAGMAEPFAALSRLEESLRLAHEEIDMLRRRPAQDSDSAELVDGFAATRPMHDAL